MKRSLTLFRAELPDHVYVELVRSLFETLLPSVVMSVLFVGVATLAIGVTGNPALLALGVAGAVASAVRLAVVIACRRGGIEQRITDRAGAARHERIFGICYLSFALLLGLFGAAAVAVGPVGLHMVVAAMLVGYAAGVAAGISLRPAIGAASMVLAVVPSALVCLWRLETFHLTLALVLVTLLAGGLQSMAARYRAEIDKIETRRAISRLARHDHLTALPNRLGLAERFEEVVADCGPECLFAVHCVDLDRFKPVNDRHGHPIGDQLLRLVANRLSGNLRSGDLAARFGGDEFVVLQCGLRHADEADLFARRLTRSLSEPYAIANAMITVGASVGYVVSQGDEPLELLLSQADNALYAIKALGGGAAAHSAARIGKATIAG